jgi:hypothetical protein
MNPWAAVGVRVPAPVGLPGRITGRDVATEDLGRCGLSSPVAAHLDECALLFVSEADEVLVDDCLSQIELRKPCVDPLDLLPAELLRRARTADDARLADAVLVTINGIAAGMR